MVYKIIEPDGSQWNIFLNFPDVFDIFICDKEKFRITGEHISHEGLPILFAEKLDSSK